MKTKISRSSGKVFADLGFGAEEADHLQIRSTLMIAVHNIISDRKLTQIPAAKLFGVSQHRISDLVRGRIEVFGIDMLVTMLSRAGVHVTVALSEARQGAA